jgi:hypothetical protein
MKSNRIESNRIESNRNIIMKLLLSDNNERRRRNRPSVRRVWLSRKEGEKYNVPAHTVTYVIPHGASLTSKYFGTNLVEVIL